MPDARATVLLVADGMGGAAGGERAAQDRAAARSGHAQRDVARQADAGDQHHHEPDVARIEHRVRAVRAVGQDGQRQERHGQQQHGSLHVQVNFKRPIRSEVGRRAE